MQRNVETEHHRLRQNINFVNRGGYFIGINLKFNVLLKIRERVGKLRIGVFLTFVVPVFVLDIDLIRNLTALHFHIHREILVLERIQRIVGDNK